MLEHVECGEMPDEAETRAKLREMAGLIDGRCKRVSAACHRGKPRSSNRLELRACLTAG